MWVADHNTDILKELRVVTRDDFYDTKGRKTYPETFYIHSFHRDVVEEHRQHGNYDWTKWREYTAAKRMYVKKQTI